MAKTPSALQTKRLPKAASVPTPPAEAAANAAGSAGAPDAPDTAAAPAVAQSAPAAGAKPAKVARDKATAKAAPKAKAKAAAPAAPKAKAAARPPVAPPVPADKPAKAHKPKLVRDSFTIPKDEYQVLDTLKGRALGLGHPVRKSELLRAGIAVLAAMNDKALLKALAAVPTLKTGRPKSA